MTFVLLLSALAVAGAGGWMSRRWRIWGQAMMGLGGLGLIGVIALQVRQNLLPPQPRIPDRCEMAVSWRLASCLLEDLGGQSGSVVLLFPQRRVMDADTAQGYEDGFLPPLRHGRGELRLKAFRIEGGGGEGGRGLSAFQQALAKAEGAMAIVSYAGVPAGIETLFPAGQSEAPLFYVYDADGTTNWLGALKEGRIRAVVLPRPEVDFRDRQAAAGTPETIFGKFFVLARAENADEVAASLKGRK
jgi:hypothetical protein